ncbi:MAG: hypothetical protein IJK18_08215 [Clostridia bacterium]|nr:hypothetical protein [Clostridia bacterium]
MNIEEAVYLLKYLTKSLKQDEKNQIYKEAIETLLTAYENLKSYNRGTKKALRVAEDLEHQANKEAGDLEARYFKLEAELEKEKEKNKKAKEFIKENSHEFNCKRDDLIELEFDYNTNATDLIDILDGNW